MHMKVATHLLIVINQILRIIESGKLIDASPKVVKCGAKRIMFSLCLHTRLVKIGVSEQLDKIPKSLQHLGISAPLGC